MARELPFVLRASREGKFEADCDAEVSFRDLLAVLGNAEAQEAIREKQPGKHCEWLRVNPHCCTACHLNPYNGEGGRDGTLYRAMEQFGHWREDAVELSDRHNLGFLSLESITPEEFEVLRIMRLDRLVTEAQVQGIEIARIIAQLFKSSTDG